MSVNFEVGGIINPVDQGESHFCWLATTATLFSWSRLRRLSMSETAALLGSPFTDYYAAGDALDAQLVPLFLQRSGLIAPAGQSRTAKGWEELLKAHGPIGVGIDADAPDNYMSHLVTMYGIVGDGTANGTIVKLIDPSGGRRLSISFRELAQRYGANDPLLMPFNVFHNN